MSYELPHEEIVTAWAQGREIPADVQAVKDWLLEQFPLGGEIGEADYERIALKASAEGWHPDALKAGLTIWHLSTIVDATDKPAA